MGIELGKIIQVVLYGFEAGREALCAVLQVMNIALTEPNLVPAFLHVNGHRVSKACGK